MAGAAGGPFPAHAVLLSRHSLRDQAELASLVIEAEVVDTWVVPSEVTPGLLNTRVELAIRDTWLGSVDSGTILLGLPGGVDERGVTDEVDGCPAFSAGETWILFARAFSEERVLLVDWTTSAIRFDATGTDPSLWDAQGVFVAGAGLDEWALAVDEAWAEEDLWLWNSAGSSASPGDAWGWLQVDELRDLVREAVDARTADATEAAVLAGAL